MFPVVGNEPIYHLQMEFHRFTFVLQFRDNADKHSFESWLRIAKVNSRFNDTAACNVSQIVSVCSLIFFL